MSDAAVRLSDVAKMYKIFPTRTDNFLDALGLHKLLPWRTARYREFWALRGINLEVKGGCRLGIVGRNGAGKTTLLRLLTQNVAPTRGAVEVRGKVQALLEVGAGFHPEFTGYENIRASLLYHGLSPREIEEAVAEIGEFTELGDFLHQPFKTMSAGMQARLTFATATAIKPEVVIIDEVLGAGDAYFLAKSRERMDDLVSQGATIVLVSHDLSQIVRLCDEAIWLDRGRIVQKGSSLEVTKAYERYIRLLDERRLKAKNRRMRAGHYSPEVGNGIGLMRLILTIQGEGRCEVTESMLRSCDRVEAHVQLGDSQDSNPADLAFVMLEGSSWSEPHATDQGMCRKIVGRGSTPVSAGLAFCSALLEADGAYTVELKYRCLGRLTLTARIAWETDSDVSFELPPGQGQWIIHRLALKGLTGFHRFNAGDQQRPAVRQGGSQNSVRVSQWPGEKSLSIEEVLLCGADDRERAVFEHGRSMTLHMGFTAHENQLFEIVPAAVLFRMDGVLVCRCIGDPVQMHLKAGDTRLARLDFGNINLGNGHYVLTVALYRKLDLQNVDPPEIYDLLDRSYEFEVFGTPPLKDGIFQHPGEWTIQ